MGPLSREPVTAALFMAGDRYRDHVLTVPCHYWGSQFDFHPDFMALPFIVWAYVYYTAERKGLYYLFFLFARRPSLLSYDVVVKRRDAMGPNRQYTKCDG